MFAFARLIFKAVLVVGKDSSWLTMDSFYWLAFELDIAMLD